MRACSASRSTGSARLLLLAVISLFLFHAAHRIYHGLHDLGVHAGTGHHDRGLRRRAARHPRGRWLLLAGF